MPFYQVKLAFAGRPSEYFIDLSSVELVKYVLLPIHLNRSLVIHGSETPAAKISKRQVVESIDPIRPRFTEWCAKQNLIPYDPKEAYFDRTKTFGIERDVTNAIFQEMTSIKAWPQLEPLLEEENRLRQELANKKIDPESELENREKLVKVTGDIAYIVGRFIGGLTAD